MLSTQRLTFREVTENDFSAVAAILRDPSVAAVWEQQFTDQDVHDWIARRQAGCRANGIDYLLAVLKSTGEPAGQIGLLRETIAGEAVWGIGYILLTRFQGQGYATEGGRAMMDYAFQTLRAPEVVCDIRPMNTASIAVARRLGMVETGSFVKIYRGREMPHLIFRRQNPA